jgi:hypothetical protein
MLNQILQHQEQHQDILNMHYFLLYLRARSLKIWLKNIFVLAFVPAGTILGYTERRFNVLLFRMLLRHLRKQNI